MDNVKFNRDEVILYDKQPGEREIHRKSGFRISHFQRAVSSDALKKINPRAFNYYSFCHLIEGDGWYWSPGKEIQYFSEGEGILASPRYVQSYGGYKSRFIEDSICFDGPVADFMFSSGVLKNGIVKIGKVRRLLPVIKEALDLSDSGQICAGASLQALLYDLYRENLTEFQSESFDAISRLITGMTNSSSQWWTVSEMADFCHISENQFRRVFKKRTGMSPKHYSDCLKMQIASERLLSSEEALDRIAEQLGYVDRFHFSKVFKRIRGISPDQYRKQYPNVH